MKTIEKITRDGDIQYFEIITNRKELRSLLKFVISDAIQANPGVTGYKEGAWRDDDSSVAFYIDGKCHCYSAGDIVKRFNVSKIQKMVNSNPSTTVIYGDVPIVYNERYGDWEPIFE